MAEFDMSTFESRNPENVTRVKRLINKFKELGYEVDAYSYHKGDSPDYFTVFIDSEESPRDSGYNYRGSGFYVDLYPDRVEISDMGEIFEGTKFSYDGVSIRKTFRGYILVCNHLQPDGFVTRQDKYIL